VTRCSRTPGPATPANCGNALERATILCDGGLIAVEHLPILVGRPPAAPASGPSTATVWSADGGTLEGVERDLIARALQEARNNRSRAARLLGITRSQLYYRIQKHGRDVAASA
jgi:two-component system NtrC family response regulator